MKADGKDDARLTDSCNMWVNFLYDFQAKNGGKFPDFYPKDTPDAGDPDYPINKWGFVGHIVGNYLTAVCKMAMAGLDNAHAYALIEALYQDIKRNYYIGAAGFRMNGCWSEYPEGGQFFGFWAGDLYKALAHYLMFQKYKGSVPEPTTVPVTTVDPVTVGPTTGPTTGTTDPSGFVIEETGYSDANPRAIAVNGANGDVVVQDADSHKYYRRTEASGQWIGVTVNHTLSSSPIDIAMDDSGNIYSIFGTPYQSVTKIDHATGDWTDTPIRRGYPTALASDKDGNLYVGTSNDTIMKFTQSTGQWTDLNPTFEDSSVTISSIVVNRDNGDIWCSDSKNFKIYRQRGGSGDFTRHTHDSINYLFTIALNDATGTLYVIPNSGDEIYEQTAGSGNFIEHKFPVGTGIKRAVVSQYDGNMFVTESPSLTGEVHVIKIKAPAR